MIDPSLPLLITAITSAIAALGAVAVSIITLFKVEKVHVATNSMKDALVKAAHAQGMQDQKDKISGTEPIPENIKAKLYDEHEHKQADVNSSKGKV